MRTFLSGFCDRRNCTEAGFIDEISSGARARSAWFSATVRTGDFAGLCEDLFSTGQRALAAGNIVVVNPGCGLSVPVPSDAALAAYLKAHAAQFSTPE